RLHTGVSPGAPVPARAAPGPKAAGTGTGEPRVALLVPRGPRLDAFGRRPPLRLPAARTRPPTPSARASARAGLPETKERAGLASMPPIPATQGGKMAGSRMARRSPAGTKPDGEMRQTSRDVARKPRGAATRPRTRHGEWAGPGVPPCVT